MLRTSENGTGFEIRAISDAEFHRFRDLIGRLAGIHLKGDKRNLVSARLSRHIRDLGLDSFGAYYDYVTRDASGAAMRDFINRITTNKTSFFREPHHFDLLRHRLIPEVERRGDRELRIWSAACSSGEEPYSIAMSLREALGDRHDWKIRILASDIDTEMLALAQTGEYTAEHLEGIPPEKRRAHFLRGYGKYHGIVQVRPELRNMIEFRQIKLNERQWMIPVRFDAIFCRNVIIYFDKVMQEQVIQGLVRQLKPDGYLFLGHSESLQGRSTNLVPVAATAYQLQSAERSRERKRGHSI